MPPAFLGGHLKWTEHKPLLLQAFEMEGLGVVRYHDKGSGKHGFHGLGFHWG